MSILVSGSIAIDHIMVFQDHFRNHIQPDKIHVLSVAFHVPELRKTYGGCAANIAYNLNMLGEDPVLLGTVGPDFEAYGEYLDAKGVRREHVRVLDDAFTAQCFITTDLDDNQITAFHPGAMDRAHEAGLDTVSEPLELGIVSPNGKQGMIENARGLKQRGIPAVIDPGQGIPMFSGPELIELLEGAAVFVANDYEWSLTLRNTGLSESQVGERVGAVIVTRGEKGSVLHEEGRVTEIPALTAANVVDPTGCGDAYRAGLLFGMHAGMPLETSARIGSVLGSMKVEHAGPQGLSTDLDSVRDRFQREFGNAF